MSMMNSKNVSKTRKFVRDGVFYSELNEFLTRSLGEDGYAGVEIRVTPIKTEIIVRATRTREVLGEKGRRIRELQSLIQKRFGFREDSVGLFADQVHNRGCCAMAQAESLRYKLLAGLPVRKACYGVMNFVMKKQFVGGEWIGATGCEVIVSGKLRAQRAKVMKFRDGYLISTGDPKKHYIQEAVRHVMMRQGVLGVKVRIMLAYHPAGTHGTSKQMPDKIIIHEPKVEAPIQTQQYDDGEEELEEIEVPEEVAEEVHQEYQEQAYQAPADNQQYDQSW